ncbi:aminotransferase class I/II-fold pyridoxal phosphate-dependent enzyme [Flavobacterium jejuense]|uniref:Aminotransferase class I/II-fold pyridoxal phosphate-dependent enzyme n=1 Tax=Flavobacterium jejuense TaxID=1544455 RepID=A0ABX0IVX4_9FLAO|nr:aminotransferase class I/II-fold pyridoxal phosphate-dependent enzyme [Flavobacterium jejuense]NHN26231.1 aminotransferase class I/II-fold pyridoxal phosphate-dependent enzyme [Flavobacterium jejuense]
MKQHIQTLAVHAGEKKGKNTDIIQPIHLSTTFERNEDGVTGEYIYTRAENPNRIAVEKKMAAIEGAKSAIAFASGMAAINALFDTLLTPNSHIIIPDDCYHGTRQLLDTFFKRWNVTSEMVDMTVISNVEKAITSNTKLIWIETPSNPQLKITDIEAVVSLAKKNAILTVCDNTFATPILQKTLEMGVDYVMYSSTKFFSGHSDILGGVVLTNKEDETSQSIRTYQKMAGAVPAPFDCWLLNRSLATFPLRFKAQCDNARKIATYLTTHPKIENVFYPGLVTHENHETAKKQMKNGFGSIISILVKGNQETALQFTSKLQIFKHATSLGGVESLVEHRRSVEGTNPISPENLIRLSIGIEHINDLIADLEQALV